MYPLPMMQGCDGIFLAVMYQKNDLQTTENGTGDLLEAKNACIFFLFKH